MHKTTREKDAPQLSLDAHQNAYQCLGSWSIGNLDQFFIRFKQSAQPKNENIAIIGTKLDYLDSAGALCLHQCIEVLKEQGNTVSCKDFSPQHQSLLKLIESNQDSMLYDLKPPNPPSILYHLGKETVMKTREVSAFIALIGNLSLTLLEAFGQWKRFQIPSILSVVYTAGIQSLPILALLSFLIGVVLAYQLGLQLQNYGANIFIAYISGQAIFREFGPLITAIIVAGRTSSSFTAQIGAMKVNEEIDAIRTMGLSAVELLVMPKILGLLFVFPLLIFWSDFFSLVGSMFMSQWILDIHYIDFLTRLKTTVHLEPMLLGLYKAPTFALLIALVGCFQGFSVNSSTVSIGSQTTRAVVQALFLIIVADAIYSVIYSWMDL